MNILIKGTLEFQDKVRNNLNELLSDKIIENVEYLECDFNGLQFEGWVECKNVFSKIDIYNLDCEVLWLNEKNAISILDREELIRYQEYYITQKEWMAVKQINVFLMELDNYEKRTTVSYYPRNLQIEHTNVCNARCIMCTHYFNKNHNGKFVDDKFVERIKPVLPYLERITLHGIGEPFLHPKILEYIRLYSSYDVKLTAVTNGSVMSQELAEEIHKSFYSITFSCDACTKETYENIRKGLSFDKFKENAKLLRSYGEKLPMRMSTVAMRQNLNELPGIVRLASELGFDLLIISDVTTQELMGNMKDSIKCFPATAAYYITEAAQVAKEVGIEIQYPEYIFDFATDKSFEEEQLILESMPTYKEESFAEELYEMYEKSGFFEPTIIASKENFVIDSGYECEGICDFVLERPYLNIKGDINLCCTNWMHIVGNMIDSKSFNDIWNGEIYQGIRKLFYSGKIPKFCVGCIFLRNDIMTNRIKLKNIDKEFYHHNYDEEVEKLMQDGIK